MKRLASLSAVALFTLAILTGCGSDSDEFCDQAREAADSAAESADLSPEDIQQRFEEFQDSAPDELQDDFDLISEIDLSDLASIDPDKAAEYQQASENIADYLTAECDVDLG